MCTQILKLMIEAPLHGEMSDFSDAFRSLETALYYVRYKFRMMECSAKTSVASLTTSPRHYTGRECFYALRGPGVSHLSQQLA